MRTMIHLLLLFFGICPLFVGCRGHNTEIGLSTVETGNYYFMKELISSLPSNEKQRWESLVRNTCYRGETPVEYKGCSEAFAAGFRQGYAFYVVGSAKVIHSMFTESTPEQEAFVSGWYRGQNMADIERMQSVLRKLAQ